MVSSLIVMIVMADLRTQMLSHQLETVILIEVAIFLGEINLKLLPLVIRLAELDMFRTSQIKLEIHLFPLSLLQVHSKTQISLEIKMQDLLQEIE